MPTLHAQDLDDLVLGTLPHLEKDQVEVIAQDLQSYEAMGRWLRKDKIQVDDGKGIERYLMDGTMGAAAHVGLYEEDNTNVGDHMFKYNLNWVHAQTKWGYEFREGLMNRGKAFLFNVIKPRRIAAMIDMADILETAAFSVPAQSDANNPRGLLYWIVYNGTAGFNGGYPSPGGVAHTNLAGVDLTVHPNFKSYTDIYTQITRTDLVFKLRKAHHKIKFVSPNTNKVYASKLARRYRIYCNLNSLMYIEDQLTMQNDNLGSDIAKMDDGAVFKGHPFIWVPYFDDNLAAGSDPFVLTDLDAFHPVVLRGDVFRQSGPYRVAKMHNVREVFTDLTYQYECTNRRANAMITKSDPLA